MQTLLAKMSAMGWHHTPANLADDEGEDDALICFICLKGDVSDDNNIVICDGDHSQPRGWHQLCC